MKKAFAALLALTMLFVFAACGDDKPVSVEDEKTITAVIGSIYEDQPMATYLRANPDRFYEKQALSYNLDTEQAKSFIENTDEWQVYSVEIMITNKTADELVFYYIESPASAEKGIWFGKESSDGEFGVVAGAENAVYHASLIARMDNRLSQEVIKDVKSVDFTLKYSVKPASENEDTIDENSLQSLVLKGSEVQTTTVAKVDDGGKKDDDNDESKGETLVTPELVISKMTSEELPSLYDIYKNNTAAFESECANFGFDKANAAEVFANGSEYKFYRITFSVKNNKDFDATVWYNKTSAGNNGIWLNRVSEYGEFSIEAGGESEMPVYVLINAEGKTEDECYRAIMELNVEFTCSKTPVENEAGLESVEDFFTVTAA